MAATTLLSSILIMATLISAVFSAKLSPTFYDDVCPKALKTIKNVVKNAVQNDPRMGASLLRLHFHDCFVKGCDASILLDDTNTINGEKNAFPNMNSIRGYEIIDNIKSAVDSVCGAPVISCADILAVAARDSVVALGGPTWNVQLGRRDSTSASKDAANNDLPPPFSDLSELIKDFKKKGLSINDLVALSGAHTIGFSKCSSFRDRIYNETNIDASFARNLRASCPANGGDDNLSPFDITPEKFDVKYFKNLVQKKGLLHSDQVLYNGGVSDKLVELYSSNPIIFFNDFAKAMVKMGNIHPLTGKKGQIRVNCRRVNN